MTTRVRHHGIVATVSVLRKIMFRATELPGRGPFREFRKGDRRQPNLDSPLRNPDLRHSPPVDVGNAVFAGG